MKSLIARYFVVGFSCVVASLAIVQTASAASPQTRVWLRVQLEGAVGGQSGLMRTDLWDLGLLDTLQSPQNSPQTPCRDGVSEVITIDNPTPPRTPVDWVCVELRTAADPSIVRARFVGVLRANGVIVRSNGTLPRVLIDQSDSYHAVVYHKSHLPVASQSIGVSPNGLLRNNFRNQSNGPFFGAHQVQVGSNWSMIAGNTNQATFDDVRDINGSDITAWSADNGKFGQYLSTDINLDGDVNGGDRILLENRNGLFVSLPF